MKKTIKLSLLLLFPITTFGADVTYNDPTFGDMTNPQDARASVVDTDFIGLRNNNTNGDFRFCDSFGFTLVSSVTAATDNYIAFWNEANEEWRDVAVNETRYSQIVCDDGTGGGGGGTGTTTSSTTDAYYYLYCDGNRDGCYSDQIGFERLWFVFFFTIVMTFVLFYVLVLRWFRKVKK